VQRPEVGGHADSCSRNLARQQSCGSRGRCPSHRLEPVARASAWECIIRHAMTSGCPETVATVWQKEQPGWHWRHAVPLDTVRLRVASTVSCTAAVHVYAALSVTYSAPCAGQPPLAKSNQEGGASHFS
jgi:hypothetical protein